jgi:membrane protein implicated in regulation of membrane protease activity
MPILFRSIVFIALMMATTIAAAYNGPGSGVSFLAALWAVLAGFFVVLSAILFWPVRAFLRRRRERAKAAAQATSAS